MITIYNKIKEKIYHKIKPENIRQASQISGITPANIALIVVYLKKNNLEFIHKKIF